MPNLVLPHFKANSKKQLLTDLSHHAAKLWPQLSSVVITTKILERERDSSTGFGNGFALPHTRSNVIVEPLSIFARLDQALDYDSVDHQPVDLIYFLLSPADNNAVHLRSLSLIARFFKDNHRCEKLRGAKDEDAIYAIFGEE